VEDVRLRERLDVADADNLNRRLIRHAIVPLTFLRALMILFLNMLDLRLNNGR
jgi:hypothetical protein